MTTDPGFLPSRLDTDGVWDRVLDALYACFCHDFKSGPVLHQGRRLIVNRKMAEDGKEECFWHLISADDHRKQERLFDPPRASRLPWIRPLVEDTAHPEVTVFDYVEGKRQRRRYVWLHDHDYVVILEHRGKAFVLVTAFYVDHERKRKQLCDRAKLAQQ